MRLIDKLFAFVSIPIGGLLLLLGIIGAFTGFEYRIALPPILGALPIILGWSMLFTLSRLWRISIDYENLRLRDELDTDEFRMFLRECPEYVEAEPRFQNKMFKRWLNQEITRSGGIHEAGQDGSGQPATRPESDPEGGDKPQSESEGGSRRRVPGLTGF